MERPLKIKTAPVFAPLLQPARYKGAYGGRGSGKSHFFATLMIEEVANRRGMLAVCIREVQKTLKESAKRLLENKLAEFNLVEADGFKAYSDRISTPGDGAILFLGMQDHTAESIKSLEGLDRAWVEEAQTLSRKSLEILRPTIRRPGSEIWFSWNPTRRTDPVDAFFRSKNTEDVSPDHGGPPNNVRAVSCSWRSNPWWNRTLENERLKSLREEPDQYAHIWEGEYATVVSGAYYAESLMHLRASGRLGRIPADPLMSYKAFWDIGGTGAKADHTVIWIAQFVGREIRVLDYYEAQGQPLATHVQWLRARGYGDAHMWLPHDGAAHDKVYATSYETALRQAGFAVTVVANQGRAAASIRIEATRRLFPRIWINQDTTVGGVDALGAYHAIRDDQRQIDLGPEHNWASHAADAFGMMCSVYEEPIVKREERYRGEPKRSWLSM